MLFILFFVRVVQTHPNLYDLRIKDIVTGTTKANIDTNGAFMEERTKNGTPIFGGRRDKDEKDEALQPLRMCLTK